MKGIKKLLGIEQLEREVRVLTFLVEAQSTVIDDKVKPARRINLC